MFCVCMHVCVYSRKWIFTHVTFLFLYKVFSMHLKLILTLDFVRLSLPKLSVMQDFPPGSLS